MTSPDPQSTSLVRSIPVRRSLGSRRTTSELREGREVFEYFLKWTFKTPANFETELGYLYDENYGPALAEKARAALRPGAKGNFRGKIVAALAEAWGVPITKVLAVYRAMSWEEKRTLDQIVDKVVEAYLGPDALARGIAAMLPKPTASEAAEKARA